jgi:hypothetical protein
VLAKFYVPAPAGEFDVSPQTQQVPAASPEQSASPSDFGEEIQDTNSTADTNSPDG